MKRTATEWAAKLRSRGIVATVLYPDQAEAIATLLDAMVAEREALHARWGDELVTHPDKWTETAARRRAEGER
jgi:hypothetical protein